MLDKIHVIFSLNSEFKNWPSCNLYYSDNGSRSYTKIGETTENSLLGKVINIPKKSKTLLF